VKTSFKDKIMMTWGLLFMWPMMFDSPKAQKDLDSGKTTIRKQIFKALKMIWNDEFDDKT